MSDGPRRALQRSRSDRMIAGVCGGIAAAANIDPTIVRLLAVLIILSSMGTGLAIYVVLALVMPLSSERAADLPLAGRQEQAGLTTTTEAPGFTPDEVKRWDLPGAVAVTPPAGDVAAAAAEVLPPATRDGG